MATIARECHHRLLGLISITYTVRVLELLASSYVDIMGTVLHMFELFFGPHLHTVREL